MAIYVTRGGIQWRMLPSDFPPWKTVYDHYRKWYLRGVWQNILDDLTKLHRRKKGRNEKPSYGIIDSQSTKTQYAREERGYNGGKKIKGRKRHLVVDVLGNLLYVKVHAANIHDTKAACDIFNVASKKYFSIEAYSADAGYCGPAVDHVDNEMKLKLYISKRITDKFAILPKRWIVERTFAWLCNF